MKHVLEHDEINIGMGYIDFFCFSVRCSCIFLPAYQPFLFTSLPTNETRASPYTDLTQKLGDRLTDYEMVGDLIERGMLAENEDGTLYIQLK